MGAAEARATPVGPELETLLELGRGGMGTAYLARALGAGGFERLVVLKRLSLELSRTEGALERFLAEASVAARLHHANIVGTHQIDRDAAGPFIVLDYIEGGSLEDLVVKAGERGQRLPVPVVLRIAKDVVSGLRAVHEATDKEGRPLQILHRDVSLQNVLVGVRDGVSRLADFGVAKSALSRTRTDPGYIVGKLDYLPPEYLRGDEVGPGLDLYALGVTLFSALTGAEPWPGIDAAVLPLAILEGLPPLSQYIDVAPEIQALVSRASAPDPRARYQSAREMGAVLENFERERGWLATQSEVAATVEDLLSVELRIRREQLAGLAPGLSAADVGERSRTLALAETKPVREPSPWPSTMHPVANAVPKSRPPARARAFLVLGGAALALGTVAGLLLRAPVPVAANPVAASPAPFREVGQGALASKTETAAATTTTTTTATAAPLVTAVPSPPAPVAEPKPSAPLSLARRRPSAPPSPTVAPLTIKTKNPYR